MPNFFIYHLKSLDLADPGMRRSRPQQRLQLVQAFILPANDHLNPTVMEISCMAMEAKAAAMSGHEPAVPNSLYLSADEELGRCHSGRGRRRRCHMM